MAVLCRMPCFPRMRKHVSSAPHSVVAIAALRFSEDLSGPHYYPVFQRAVRPVIPSLASRAPVCGRIWLQERGSLRPIIPVCA